ncbi:MAG: ketopantoate reductase family protein [Planctomycetota bacterium]
MNDPLRVLVVGPGALGESLARLLEQGGARVARLGRRGLVPDGRLVQPEAFRGEVGLLTVKSYQTEAAVIGAERWLEDEAMLISLQNGIGNVEVIAAHRGDALAAGGSTTHAARRLPSGEVVHTAHGDTFVAPRVPAGAPRLEAALLRLAGHGLAVTREEELLPLLWRKLAVSCGVNALTAVLSVRNGALLQSESALSCLREVTGEVDRVAESLGLTGLPAGGSEGSSFGGSGFERACAVARATAENRSSMLQDLAAGRRTEVDALNGAVVKRARALGIPAPWNHMLVRLVRAREELNLAKRSGGGTTRQPGDEESHCHGR